MKDWIDNNIGWITRLLITCVVVAIIGAAIVVGVVNEQNRIDAGIIIDKHMSPGGTYYSANKNGGQMHSYPASYSFTILGEKDGETVEYTFNVTADEYIAYKIGDEYRR